MTAPSLELRDLQVLAGTRVRAGPLSVVQHAGSVLWLTGENGAGKSLLLRAIAQRSRYRGTLSLTPVQGCAALCYYSPVMHIASGICVADWLHLQRRIQPRSGHADLVDAMLPAGASGAIARLSTGEAKRLVLWSLLRVSRHFYILDEPYEHLSRSAKGALTSILAALAPETVVVVATNQDIPSDIPARVLELD